LADRQGKSLWLILFGVLFSLPRPALAFPDFQDAQPVVYTGALLYQDSPRATLARLFLLPGAGDNPFEAHLVLHHGSFDSREYVPVVFDKVEAHGDTEFLLTSSRMTGAGMPLRHPVVELGKPAGETLEGVFNSGIRSRVGVLRLARGWRVPEGLLHGLTVTPSFEGFYLGDCVTGRRGDMLTGLEIYSTRSQLEDMVTMPATDVSVEANAYQGGTICRDIDGLSLSDQDLACGGFNSGHYDHYTGKLMLFMTPAWRWPCEYDPAADSLICETVRFRRCELFRLREREPLVSDTTGYDPASTKDLPPAIQAARMTRSSGNDSSGNACADLKRRIPGLLHHAWTGLYQRVGMDLVVTQAGPGQCKVSGFLVQGFDTSPTPSNHDLTHVIDPFVFNLDDQVIRLGSGHMGDAVLVLERKGLHFSGQWYSRLFGLVGMVEFDPAISFDGIPAAEFVPSVSGVFVANPQNDIKMIRTLTLSAATDSADSRSFNPIRQQPTNGILKSEVIGPDGQGYGLQTMQEIPAVIYDYFTGRAVFTSQSAQFYGTVLPRGMNLRMITTNESARYMPRAMRWEFERQGHSKK
jgi:hypothetical protein